jgi:DNA polymerase-3 subunit alpha
VSDRRDKDQVTIGGIITEAKRIRTRNGDHMMFATLDDLTGSVEILVFGKALSETEASLDVDALVIVRGRVDHREAGKTSVVVQSVSPFDPSEQEVEQARARAEAASRAASMQSRPVHLRVSAGDLTGTAIEELKQMIEDFPGPAEVLIDVLTAGGTRRLRLGSEYRVQHTPTLRAELENALAPQASAATG